MKRFTFFGCFFAACLFSYSQSFDFTPKGKKGEIVRYDQFTLCYSEEHEQPFWVAYKLTQSELELPIRDRISPVTFVANLSRILH
ncbi:MAG: hypothetical protein GKR88_10545 [Flavobacteriaceae bacterium]|nr:MAG: hypothetical protein GKR88_10545 [Flavobacteriaceae bacterium]